jgi:cytoskeletal protein RodZ
LPAACRDIGAQLAAARDAGQLSVEGIASKLLLSRGQVLGLEQADPAPFYNNDFYLRALRKYMTAMGLPADLLDQRDEEEEEGGLRLILAEMAPARVASRMFSGRQVVTAAAGLLVMIGAGWWAARAPWSTTPVDDGDTVTLQTSSPLPAQPIRVEAAAPQPVSAVPATMDPDPASTVRISVGKSTWVFVRYPDNRVVERSLAAGDELEVGPLPVFLAVGTADSVEVRVENRPVALGPYIRNGQVRMTKPELASLVP